MSKSLDMYSAAEARNYHFLISVACLAGISLRAPEFVISFLIQYTGPENYQNLHISAIDKYLDFWNLMAYDYSGS